MDGSNGFVIKTDETASFNSVYGETAGDLNGDGIDDIVVAHYRDNGESANHVILGTAYGFDASLDIATLDGTNGFTLPTISSSDLARSATSAGDVNGDGIDDLLIGAYGASANGSGNGETYILFGSTDGFDATFDLSTLDGTNGYVLQGSGYRERSGYAVASADDVNADGTADVIIGAPSIGYRSDPESTAYVVYGGPDNLAALDFENGTADGKIQRSFIDTATSDTADKDDLKGNDYRDRFVMLDDGQSDIVRDFEIGVDKFDVTDLGASSIDDLIISNLTRKDGSISWVAIHDASGQREMQVRFTEETPLDAGAFGADDFVFGTESSEPVEPNVVKLQDLEGRNKLRRTDVEEEFVMLSDGQSDIVFHFDVGVD